MQGEDGFTLIEALVAIFISAALVAVFAASMRVGLDSFRKGSSAVETGSEKRFVVKALDSGIGSAMPFRERYGFDAALVFRGGAANLSLETACGEVEPVTCGGTKLVAFDSTARGLIVSAMTLPPAPGSAPAITSVFGEVEDLSFEYLGGDAWRGDWDAAAESALPEAVRARVTFKDGQKTVFTILLRASEKARAVDEGRDKGMNE